MKLLKHNKIVSPGIIYFEGIRGYVATGDMDEVGNLSSVGVDYMGRPSRANQETKFGDVIFARMANTVKVREISKDDEKLIFSTGFCVLRPDKKEVESRYLYHYLKTHYFQRKKDNLCTGATQKAITNDKLDEIELPLPRIDIQRHIATILDKADDIRRKRQESIRLIEEYIRAVFLDMFGDPAINPKGLDKAPIKELGSVMTGNTPPRERAEYYGDGVEWIKSDNINTPYHFLTEAKERLTAEGQKVGRTVPKKSILVTCIAGSPDCIGNAAITDRAVAFNQQINAVSSFQGVDPYFLYVQILVAKKLIQQQSTESMKGMVSKGKFENILFLNPPYPLQEKFGKVFKKWHDVFLKNNDVLSESNNLYGSLTQKAFKGEL